MAECIIGNILRKGDARSFTPRPLGRLVRGWKIGMDLRNFKELKCILDLIGSDRLERLKKTTKGLI
jgi:hypothetical protein